MRFSFLLSLFFLGCLATVFAQHPIDTDLIEENLIDEIISDSEEEFDYSEVSGRLNYYLQNPIDLNRVDAEQLSELLFLSPLQINSLLEHRKLAGAFISLYELQAVRGFDEKSIQRLLPFVFVGENGMSAPVIKEGKHELTLRYSRLLESQRGYQSQEEGRSRYLGSPDRMLLRYRYRLGNKWRISFNAEKDAGEPFFEAGNTKGFDFYSGSIYVTDMARVKSLVIGDYSIQSGQGLSLWNGLSFGKGSLVQNVARQGVGLKPFTSTNESQFLRGTAATFALGRVELTPFISYKKVDANLSADSLQFSSLLIAGYHRTPNELQNRGTVSQTIYGMNVSYQASHFQIGSTVLRNSFDKPMMGSSQVYNQFSFSGSDITNSSIYYNYTLRNVYGFGEVAHHFGGGFGLVNGMIGSLSHRLSMVILHRYYQKDFYSLLGQGFSENSRPVNERGLYTGLIWNPNRRVEWVAFADYFRFPWLKYRVDGPSSGFDLFSQFSFAPTRVQHYAIRFRYRVKAENDRLDEPVNTLADVERYQIRAQANYQVHKKIKFRNRLEFIRYSKGIENAEQGYLLSQDMFYQPQESAISGNLRLAYFRTDGYNSRIYAFENDVLYGSSFPAYADQGVRLYGNLRWRIKRQVDLWMRYAAFLYAEPGIGSALDFIEGKRKSEVKIQVRIQL